MTQKTCLRSLVLVGAITLLAGLPGAAADKKDNKKNDKKPAPNDPPATAAIMNQYRGWFAVHDLNKDGYLDKEELAKVFRGPTAKAYDYQPPAKTEPKTTEEPPKSAPTDTDATRQAYYARLQDYQFLAQLDRDKDERIGIKEFETWAHDLARVYADQLKQVEDAQKRILDYQNRLARNPNPRDRNRLEDDLRRERQQADRLRDRLRELERQRERFRNNRR